MLQLLRGYRAPSSRNYIPELPPITFEQIVPHPGPKKVRARPHIHPPWSRSTTAERSCFWPAEAGLSASGDGIHGFLPFMRMASQGAWPGPLIPSASSQVLGPHPLPRTYLSSGTGSRRMWNWRKYSEELTEKVEQRGRGNAGKNRGHRTSKSNHSRFAYIARVE